MVPRKYMRTSWSIEDYIADMTRGAALELIFHCRLPPELKQMNCKVAVYHRFDTDKKQVDVSFVTRAGKAVKFTEDYDGFPSKMLLSKVMLVY